MQKALYWRPTHIRHPRTKCRILGIPVLPSLLPNALSCLQPTLTRTCEYSLRAFTKVNILFPSVVNVASQTTHPSSSLVLKLAVVKLTTFRVTKFPLYVVGWGGGCTYFIRQTLYVNCRPCFVARVVGRRSWLCSNEKRVDRMWPTIFVRWQ
jgi:hypothetical protein